MSKRAQDYSVLSPITGDRRYKPGDIIQMSPREARPLLAAGVIATESRVGNGERPGSVVAELSALLGVMSESEIVEAAREIAGDENLRCRLDFLLEASQMASEAGRRAQKIRDAADAVLKAKAPDTLTKAGQPTLAALRTETELEDLSKPEVEAALRSRESTE